MTALCTSLALPLCNVESTYRKWPTPLEKMIFLAVRKCMIEQYWSQ